MSIDTATGAQAPAEVSTARVKAIFASIAKKYDRFNAISSFGAYRHWLTGMMRVADVQPDDDVLDVAGGTGEVAFTVAHTFHPAHIQLTDLVPEMLDVAKGLYADGLSDGVPFDFEVVDAQDMPFADNSYHIITMAYGIRNMPERERALAEVLRVLKPGGQFVCLEFSTPPNALWRGLYKFYLMHILPLVGKVVTGDRSGFDYLAKSIRAFPAQAEYAKMLEDAGFVDVQWTNYTGGIAAVHTARKPEKGTARHPESQVRRLSGAI